MNKKLLVIIVMILLSYGNSVHTQTLNESFYYQDNIYSPVRISIDEQKNIYFTDSFKRCACRMDVLGQIQLKITAIGMPMGIAVDKNLNIFVSDRLDSSVKIFDAAGNQIGLLGTKIDEFRLPSDVEIDKDGNIYVVDSNENCIKVYSAQRDFSYKFGEGVLQYPTCIGINDQNGELVIGQDFQDPGGQIFVFSKNGNLLRQFGILGHSHAEFTRIQGITVDSLGQIYVCDAFQSIVQVLDNLGNHIKSIGGYGKGLTQLMTPLDIVQFNSTTFLITSYNSSRISVLNSDSSYYNLKSSIDNQQDNSPKDFLLLQNFPNPCNPSTWIPYELHKNSYVAIKIFNVRGERIKTFDIGFQLAGEYKSPGRALFWDGKNERGIEVPSGIYFYRIQGTNFKSSKKLIIMK